MVKLAGIVGVDVGGTYTDAVYLCNGEVLGVAKAVTSEDVTSGVRDAISKLVKILKDQGLPTKFRQVNIGTTHFVNAVLQKRSLTKVAILRLCGSASRAIEPCIEFPQDLKEVVYDSHHFLNGGYQFDGQAITPLDQEEVIRCIADLRARDVQNIAVSCVFASVNGEQENEVRRLIRKHYPEASVTLAHEVGQLGLLERENAAILNECLKPLCRVTIKAFRNALDELQIECPFYMTQNDGTILGSDLAVEFPVRTFSSGPTNSMRGAVHLSGVTHNAVVVDIGGTSTDVGFLVQGFPRESPTRSQVAGVSTNFRMPEVRSIGLGGGSMVTVGKDQENITVGPQSVGYHLLTKALVFGGETLTATDIAIAAGLADLPGADKERLRGIPESVVSSAVDRIHQMVEEAIDQIKVSGDDVPVIVVGGGSILIDADRGLFGTSRLIKTPHFQSANAVGACLSQVSGLVDFVANVTNITREEAIADAEERARKAAIRNGAQESSIEITERAVVGMTYIPGNAVLIKVKAVGKLALSEEDDDDDDDDDEIVLPKGDPKPVNVDNQPAQSPGIYSKASCNVEQSDHDPATSKSAEDHEPKRIAGHLASEGDDKPNIDPVSGEWSLSERDIEYISIGAGLLASGGGGSPYLGKLWALKQLRSGRRIRVIAPERMGTTPASQGYAVPIGYMGAPAVFLEKLINGTENYHAVSCLNDVLAADKDALDRQALLPDPADEELKGLRYAEEYTLCSSESASPRQHLDPADEELKGLRYAEEYTLCSPESASPRKHLGVIIPWEIGGLNSMQPLTAGAELDMPVLDCDGMGRAFPELQMFTPSMYGSPIHPCCLVFDGTKQAVVLDAQSPLQVERCFRRICSQHMGCMGLVSYAPLSKEEVTTKSILYSISRTWHLGRTVMKAWRAESDPVSAILKSENGLLLIRGKITDVSRETTGGFDIGRVTVEGLGEHTGTSLSSSFQNEFLVATQKKMVDGELQEKVLAMTPDIITLTDADKGLPISTDEIQYGARVAVLALPSPSKLRTPEALRVIGPRAMNFDMDYVPVAEYVRPKPVPPID